MELQENADWYQYLDECQKKLVTVSFSLLNKKEALIEATGRTVGWWSLLFNKPNSLK